MKNSQLFHALNLRFGAFSVGYSIMSLLKTCGGTVWIILKPEI